MPGSGSVVVFVRHPSAKDKDIPGIREQSQAIEEFCDRERYQVAHWFQPDSDISKVFLDRPVLCRAVALAGYWRVPLLCYEPLAAFYTAREMLMCMGKLEGWGSGFLFAGSPWFNTAGAVGRETLDMIRTCYKLTRRLRFSVHLMEKGKRCKKRLKPLVQTVLTGAKS